MEIKYKQYNKFMNCAIVSRSWYNIEKWLQIFSIDKQNGTLFKKMCWSRTHYRNELGKKQIYESQSKFYPHNYYT